MPTKYYYQLIIQLAIIITVKLIVSHIVKIIILYTEHIVLFGYEIISNTVKYKIIILS